MSTLIQKNGQTAEDAVLYGNPKMTYFKKVFMKKRNYTAYYSKLSKKVDNIQFGDKNITIQIPNAGDLLGGIYIDFRLNDLVRKEFYNDINNKLDTSKESRFTSYVNGIGFNIIDRIDLLINGITIQSLTGELIYLLNQLHADSNKLKHFNTMTNYHDNFIIGKGNGLLKGRTNNTSVRCQLPIPFFFSKDPGQYLPLCNLENILIQIKITLKPFTKCIVKRSNINNSSVVEGVNGYIINNSHLEPNGRTVNETEFYNEELDNLHYNDNNISINQNVNMIESFDVFTRVIYMDPDESRFFKSKDTLQYLVDIFHEGIPQEIKNPNSNSFYTVNIESNHPTKYLLWILQREDVFNDNHYQNYTYKYSAKYGNGLTQPDTTKHIIDSVKITLDGIPLFENINPVIISNIMKYDHLKGSADESIYIYNMSLNPDDVEPSGSINLSSYRDKLIEYSVSEDAVKEINNDVADSEYKGIIFRHYVAYFNILNIVSGTGANLVYT